MMRIGQERLRGVAAMAGLANDTAVEPRRRARVAERLASALARCASRGRPGGVIASTENGVVTPQLISAIARRKSKRGIKNSTEGRVAEPEALQICLGTKPSALKMGL